MTIFTSHLGLDNKSLTISTFCNSIALNNADVLKKLI